MWTREERHFRSFPKKMEPGEVTDCQGRIIKGFTPHILTTIWYSTYQGWELSEVTLTGHVQVPTLVHGEEGKPLLLDGPLGQEGRVIKLVSGAKRPLLMADWINERIEATRPEGTSKFVSENELAGDLKRGRVRDG